MDTNSYPHADTIIVFKENEATAGTSERTVSFADYDLCPCSYDQLANAKANDPITIQLELLNARILGTNIDSLDTEKRFRAGGTLESRFTSRAIGLVKGGWLPSALAAHKPSSTLLIDRNVVTEITGRFDGGQKTGRDPDFLDLFADAQIRINPLLYALEGNHRSFPSAELVRAQFEEVCRKLRSALPKAEVIAGPEVLQGALGLLEESKVSFEARQTLLQELAPTLSTPTAFNKIAHRIQFALSVADRLRVPRQSILILAIMSSIAVPNGRSPASALLKFKPDYSSADAYNALCDIRALDLLTHFFALFPQECLHLCTTDRDLALLWCGANASNFGTFPQGISFDLSPIPALLPRGVAQIWHDAVA